MPEAPQTIATGSARNRLRDGSPPRQWRGERLVAVFEATKGLLVLVVGFGLLSVVHQGLEQVAEEVVRRFHLNPASRYPRIFLEVADHLSDIRIWLLAACAFGYAGLRLAEAFGLWRGRRWAEWLAAVSGAIYVPMEIHGLVASVSFIKVATLAANVAIVAYMSRVLWQSRRVATSVR